MSMTENELKAIEERARRTWYDAREDVLALVAEVRRLRRALPENMRCSLCLEPLLTPDEIKDAVCKRCDPDGQARALRYGADGITGTCAECRSRRT